MSPLLAKLANPDRWRVALRRALDNRERRRLDDVLDTAWAARGPLAVAGGPTTVVADAMWYNPNHFLRLRLFLEALAETKDFGLLGVVRSRSCHRERRALERIGFRDFLYLDEDDEFRTESFLDAAAALLAPVESHDDLLRLVLPHDLPAYTAYDTALKVARDPQPALDHPVWRASLAETLRDLAIYDRELKRRRVGEVVLSHPWKAEWASLLWLAVGEGIPVYHLTGFVEAMRVRRFRSRDDYRNPVEHLPRASYEALPADVRDELARIGAAQLERRASGASNDINARHAFRPEMRIEHRARARQALAGDGAGPVVTVYGHVWYDFPHTFAMANFTDFRDWIELTLERIATLDHVTWLLKPHPTEAWYGGFRLAEVARELPPHVRLLPMETDNKTVLTASDGIITVHGTVGLEAAALGLPVVLADRSYFSDWGIAHVAADRADYLRLLDGAATLTPPDEDARRRARAAFALALAEPPEDGGALPMSCDSLGAELYREVIGRVRDDDAMLAAERARLHRFLDQDAVDSYAAFHLVELARARAGAQAAVSAPGLH